MSNVLIGIVGVVLFIGLALAGASFFGPSVTRSVDSASAQRVMSSIATTAMAVSYRNRDLETTTAAGYAVADLSPAYMAEEASAGPGIPPAVLMSPSGSLTDGPAKFVVVDLGSSEKAGRICSEINASALGQAGVPQAAAIASRSSGCGTGGAGFGSFPDADLLAFQRIS